MGVLERGRGRRFERAAVSYGWVDGLNEKRRHTSNHPPTRPPTYIVGVEARDLDDVAGGAGVEEGGWVDGRRKRRKRVPLAAVVAAGQEAGRGGGGGGGGGGDRGEVDVDGEWVGGPLDFDAFFF